MKKSTAALNKRLRQERKNKELVEYRGWGTPAWKLELKAIADKLQGSEASLKQKGG